MVEIAGDESGSDGENLASATHRFFTYGTTDVSWDEASRIIVGIRESIGSTPEDIRTARELKSGPLIARHKEVIAALISPGGALHGRTSIYVVDKQFFLAGKLISLLVEEEAYERGVVLGSMERQLAVELMDEVAPRLGSLWGELLGSFNRLARFYKDASRSESPYDFLKILKRVHEEDVRCGRSTVVEMLWSARMQALAIARSNTEQMSVPNLEPLIPVIFALSSHWTDRFPGHAIDIIADNQSALKPAALEVLVNVAPAIGSGLRSITPTDSEFDPRLQVADLVAGLGRYAAQQLQDDTPDALSHAAIPAIDPNGLWSPSSPVEQALRPVGGHKELHR